jgi:hypothetical protein
MVVVMVSVVMVAVIMVAEIVVAVVMVPMVVVAMAMAMAMGMGQLHRHAKVDGRRRRRSRGSADVGDARGRDDDRGGELGTISGVVLVYWLVCWFIMSKVVGGSGRVEIHALAACCLPGVSREDVSCGHGRRVDEV